MEVFGLVLEVLYKSMKTRKKMCNKCFKRMKLWLTYLSTEDLSYTFHFELLLRGEGDVRYRMTE